MINADLVPGEPFELEFIIKDENDQPRDITGYTAYLQMRAGNKAGELVGDYSSSGAELSVDAQAGSVKLILEASVTREADYQRAFADLLLINGPDGIRSDAIEINVVRGITV